MVRKSSQRPFAVTLLIAVVLIFTSLNILRVVTALLSRSFLSTLPLQVPVWYFTLTGTIWSVIGIILGLGLITRRKWALSLSIFLTIGYSAFYWVDRLFIIEWALFKSRWQFAFGLTIFIVLFALWTVKSSKTRVYLNK